MERLPHSPDGSSRKEKGGNGRETIFKEKIIGNCPELKRADDIAIKNTLTYREF